jgi:hypothetical protein
MTDPTKFKNLTLDVETYNIISNWSDRELRTVSMQIRWMVLRHAPPELLNAPSIIDVDGCELPAMPQKAQIPPLTDPQHLNFKRGVARFRETDGWQRKRRHITKMYQKIGLHQKSLMFKVLVTLHEYCVGEDFNNGLTNFELADLVDGPTFDSYAKVTSTAYNGGLVERRSLNGIDRRGYYAYRLTEKGQKVLRKAQRLSPSELVEKAEREGVR